MGISPVQRPECDLCARCWRCDHQGLHTRDVLFAWAGDRDIPVCALFVEAVRAALGYVPLPPHRWLGKSVTRRV